MTGDRGVGQFAVCAVRVALASRTTPVRAVDPEAAGRIRPRDTTKAKVREWFGEPTGRSVSRPE